MWLFNLYCLGMEHVAGVAVEGVAADVAQVVQEQKMNDNMFVQHNKSIFVAVVYLQQPRP